MADHSAMRSCRKTACRWPAAASLSYRYDTRQVWLLDLVEKPDPSLYDLCPPHADALVVPNGWERVDQRVYAEPVVEPAGRDLVLAPARREQTRDRVPVGSYGSGRYEALSKDLPRLARELAEREEAHELERAERDAAGGEAAERDAAGAGAAERGVAGPERPERADPPAPRPMPSRDLAPLPAGDALSGTPASASDAETGPGETAEPPTGSARDTGGQLPGQLAIPVPETEEGIGEAVVVSIERAGSRRRAVADESTLE